MSWGVRHLVGPSEAVLLARKGTLRSFRSYSEPKLDRLACHRYRRAESTLRLAPDPGTNVPGLRGTVQRRK